MSKAKNLCVLKKEGYNVPDFIVLDENYKTSKNIELSKFLSINNNKFFAVRSSANVEDGSTFSYAGIFDTFLNIHSSHIPEFIDKCFKAMSSSRLQAYCLKNGQNIEEITMNVIIQVMIVPDVSGIMFTKHPANNSEGTYIECAYGLCEPIVDGRIDPDKILVKEVIKYETAHQEEYLGFNNENHKNDFFSVPLLEQSRKKLDNESILSLVFISNCLKDLYNSELDIEWAIKDGLVFLLQVRPLTAMILNNL